MMLGYKDFKIQNDRFFYDGNEPITKFSTDVNKIGKDFLFINTVFAGECEIEFNSKNVIFEDCIFEEGVKSIGENNTITISGNFSGCEIIEPNSKVTVKLIEENVVKTINNICSAKLQIFTYGSSRLKIENIESKSIRIVSATSQNHPLDLNINVNKVDSFSISNIEISRLEYQDSKFQVFEFNNCLLTGKGQLLDFLTPKTKSLVINNLKTNYKEVNLRITGLEFDDDFNFLKYLELKDIDCDILNLEFATHFSFLKKLTYSSDNELIIQSASIYQRLTIENLVFSGNFTIKNLISDVKIKNLRFDNFEAENTFTFQNLEIMEKGELAIGFSDMNNVTFKPSIFHRFESIAILGSNFVGMKLIGFVFVDKNKFSSKFKDIKNLTFTTNNVRIFRYLKNCTYNDGDLDSYQKYRSYEFNETFLRNKCLKGPEKFVLWFNKVTNNHTTDWFKAFINFFIIFILYLVFLTLSLFYSINDFDNIILKISGILPYLLSPVSFLVNYKDFDFHYGIYIFDFFYNIGIGLLLYQMIAAFRKFNR